MMWQKIIAVDNKVIEKTVANEKSHAVIGLWPPGGIIQIHSSSCWIKLGPKICSPSGEDEKCYQYP